MRYNIIPELTDQCGWVQTGTEQEVIMSRLREKQEISRLWHIDRNMTPIGLSMQAKKANKTRSIRKAIHNPPDEVERIISDHQARIEGILIGHCARRVM